MAHQFIQGVVQRAQVGVHLLCQVARQKAQALAGLNRRARQHNALHRAALQGIHGAGHCQIGLARACGPNAEGDVVGGNVLQVQALGGCAPTQVGPAGAQHDGVLGRFQQFAVTSQHQLQVVFRDGALGNFVQRLQQLHRLRGLGLGAVHLELLVPVGNAHAQGHLDGAQVRVRRATQVGQAGVVVREEGVAQDHADNSSRQKSQ